MANNIWAEEINDYIDKIFPHTWKKSDVGFFIKDACYVLDLQTLNKSLNLPIRNFIKMGGKRLRPVLFFTCLKLFGKKYKKYIQYAVMLELIHNGTLILDDIEDRSLLRRNKPTCHIKYGVDTAINAGASLYVIPLRFVFENKKLSPEIKLRILKIYFEEISNLCFGQAIDINWHKMPEIKVTKSKYLEMVRLKTGSLMRMSVRIACALAEKNEKTEEYFSKFAEAIGMAFQIRDDILDLANSNGDFGKMYGNDITEGKISLPVVVALECLPPLESSRVKEILIMHTRDKKIIEEAIVLINKSNALKISLDIAEKIVRNAWQNLEKEWNNKTMLRDLKQLAEFFIERKY